MVKKLDEIKEAISTNTTPVKGMTAGGGDRVGAGGDGESAECESTDGSEGGDRCRKISAPELSHRGSYTNLKDWEEALPESLFPPSDGDDKKG